MFTPVNSPFNMFPSFDLLKKMGFLADQDGIFKRHINEEGGWNSHLVNAQLFIKDCLKDQKFKSVSILGSGWLLDVPVRFLAENFNEVIFYDLRHPREVKHKYRNHSNFKFIEIDLTGGLIEQVYVYLNSGKNIDLHEIEQQLVVPDIKLPYQSDFVVSLNILNQLDILIVDYIRKKINLPDTFANKLRSNIQQKHLELLQKSRSCMISDYEEINLDRENNVTSIKSLLFAKINMDLIQKKWIWNFDSQMTYHKNHKTNFNVMAIKF